MSRLSTERLFLVDPYNDKHISMIATFEQKYGLSTKYIESMGQIRSTGTKEEYLQKIYL